MSIALATNTPTPGSRPPRIFVVAGEHSGDALGAKLIEALKAMCTRGGTSVPEFAGVGGDRMAEQGLQSLFPLSDVIVMGPGAIARRLPTLISRVYRTVDAAVAFMPDIVVIVDSPEFTHPIARRIRKRLPRVPIVDYVSPSVWAWRPGRARRMRPYVDHVLALLPFEPKAHADLGGPACTYVGHPLIERAAWIDKCDPRALATRLGIAADEPIVLLLPGSRASEVSRLMQPFGAAIDLLRAQRPPFQVIIPTVTHVRPLIEAASATWAVRPHIVSGDDDKFAAFRGARAALAASGTVTLELALAGTPMVVAYRVERLATLLRFLVKVPSIVLANLVLGENAFPELIQEDCTPDKLAKALSEILDDTPARARQLAALARIRPRMGLGADGKLAMSPSDAAARIVLDILRSGKD